MKIPRSMALPAAMLLAAVALSACSGTPGATTPAATTTSTTAQRPSPPSSAPNDTSPTPDVRRAGTASAGGTAAPGPATFRVLAGTSDGAYDIEQFMPRDITVREGDTIEWVSKGIEGHTVTFAEQRTLQSIMASYLVPDSVDPQQQMFNPDLALRSQTGETFDGTQPLVNSGFFGVPTEQTYRLTFTKRGVYTYLCLVHPLWMRGTVSVDAPASSVDAPEVVAARGRDDVTRLMAIQKQAVDTTAAERRDGPAPAGATLYRVAVGVVTPYGQVATFVPPASRSTSVTPSSLKTTSGTSTTSSSRGTAPTTRRPMPYASTRADAASTSRWTNNRRPPSTRRHQDSARRRSSRPAPWARPCRAPPGS